MDLAVIIEHPSQERTIVRLWGELDISSAPDLREQLLVILDRQSPGRLILDLSELEFMDSSGTAVLVNTERRARLLGSTLALVGLQAPVWRVLRICGLDQHFLIFDTISAAAGGPAAAADGPAAAADGTQAANGRSQAAVDGAPPADGRAQPAADVAQADFGELSRLWLEPEVGECDHAATQ